MQDKAVCASCYKCAHVIMCLVSVTLFAIFKDA